MESLLDTVKRPAWWAAYSAAVWFVPVTVDKTYTKLNLLLMLMAYSTKARGGMWAALLVNFVAINTSFHFSLLEDDTVFEKFSKKLNVGMKTWHVLNVAAHVAPLIVLLRERYRIRRTTAKERFLLAAGTAAMHLMWGIRVSRKDKRIFACDLSHIYIDLKDESWKRMWAIAVLGHFAGSSILP